MRNIISYLIIIVMSVGCSTVQITKTSDSTYTDGLRFYRPDLYLLVTKDDTGKTRTSIIPLPNKKEEYVIRPVARIGTVDASATLTDGWNLAVLGAKIDTKVPEMINALTGTLATAAVVAATPKKRGEPAAPQPEPEPLKPGLYRINFTDGVVSGITKIDLR